MTYIRSRMLTRRRVSWFGAPDILSVALEASYNSHEAFTRAFGLQFGVTPEALRPRHSRKPRTVEPSSMSQSAKKTKLENPRMVEGKPLLVAGLSQRSSTSKGMPAQWQRFVPISAISRGRWGARLTAFSIMAMTAATSITCAAWSEGFFRPAGGLFSLRIPAQYYAVFPHREHISTIHST